MLFHFHGAARTTTGSMHVMDINGTRILLDCGLYQGKRKEAFEKNRNLPLDPKSVDVCVLSHAHIDHSGNLPTFVKHGYEGKILATPATRDLCEIMLYDSAYLQQRDVEYVNKKRARQGKNLFEPLYVQEDVDKCLNHYETIEYDSPTNIAPGVSMTFHDAGHILGSALTTFDISENGSTRRLLFTGDMGRNHMPILEDPVVVDNIDILLTESTYGNRLHPSEEDVKQKLTELCRKVTDRKSRLVIPAFSVGRTQQLLYFLHEMWREGRLCDIPVYVDSPLSSKATDVYRKHPECYDEDAIAIARDSEDPFSFARARCITSLEDSMKLNDMKGPVIIISASGMCEGGRILHHLKRTVGNENDIILIVGYQAENTLGRRLLENTVPIRIFGEEFTLKAEVHNIQALSAHADRDELLKYFRNMGPHVNHAFVVHGEPEQAEPFALRLTEMGAKNTVVPEPGQTVEI